MKVIAIAISALLAPVVPVSAAQICESTTDNGVTTSYCYSEAEYEQLLKERAGTRERINREFDRKQSVEIAKLRPQYIKAAQRYGVAADCKVKAQVAAKNMKAADDFGYGAQRLPFLVKKETLICMESLIAGRGYVPGIGPGFTSLTKTEWMLTPDRKRCYYINDDGSKYYQLEDSWNDSCRSHFLEP